MRDNKCFVRVKGGPANAITGSPPKLGTAITQS